MQSEVHCNICINFAEMHALEVPVDYNPSKLNITKSDSNGQKCKHQKFLIIYALIFKVISYRLTGDSLLICTFLYNKKT